jgi:hypothetical protein
MASYVRKRFVLGNGDADILPLNRWSEDDYSIQVELGTVTVAGTLAQLNREETPVWATLDDSGGTPLAAVGVGIYNVDFVPLEAIRLTAGAGGATVIVMQQGDC